MQICSILPHHLQTSIPEAKSPSPSVWQSPQRRHNSEIQSFSLLSPHANDTPDIHTISKCPSSRSPTEPTEHAPRPYPHPSTLTHRRAPLSHLPSPCLATLAAHDGNLRRLSLPTQSICRPPSPVPSPLSPLPSPLSPFPHESTLTLFQPNDPPSHDTAPHLTASHPTPSIHPSIRTRLYIPSTPHRPSPLFARRRMYAVHTHPSTSPSSSDPFPRCRSPSLPAQDSTGQTRTDQDRVKQGVFASPHPLTSSLPSPLPLDSGPPGAYAYAYALTPMPFIELVQRGRSAPTMYYPSVETTKCVIRRPSLILQLTV